MKTMMKKCGIVVACAVALFMVLTLVIGCPQSGSGYQPPAGMGSVQLRFNETIERQTFLPIGATIAIFKSFRLDISPDTGGSPPGTTTVNDYFEFNAAPPPIALTAGDYILTVVAYTDEYDGINAPTQAAATGSANFNVAGITTVPITLTAYDPVAGGGTGTFAWVINNNVTTLSTATMTVTTLAGGATTITNLNLLSAGNLDNTASPTPLTAGYYYVDFRLTVGTAIRTFRHVLHIYRGMTTTLTYDFDDTTLGIVGVTVGAQLTFTFDPLPTAVPPVVSPTGVIPVSIGGTPTTATITVTNAVAAAYTSIAWYCYGAPLTTTSQTAVADDTLTINTATTAPFNIAGGGRYQVTVTGTVGGKPYSTEFFVVVTDDT
jgi:hypothetical protein